jgi:hypothetical protein
MNDDQRPVTPKEWAEILEADPKTVYDSVKRGETPHFKIGRLIFIPRPWCNAMLRSGKSGNPQT